MSRTPSKPHIAPKSKRSTSAKPLTVAQARQLTQRQPQRASSWKQLGNCLIQVGQHEEARDALNQAIALAPEDHETLGLLAGAEYKLGHTDRASELVKRALEISPDFVQAHLLLSTLLYDRGYHQQALEHIERADQLKPGNAPILAHMGSVLKELHQYEQALAIRNKVIELQPDNDRHWNNIANLLRDLGRFEEADQYYQKAISLSSNDPLPLSNRISTLHYRPDFTREAIFAICREWQTRYASSSPVVRPQPADRSPQRRIRIGMFSDGFRGHPVGQMITTVLENLGSHEFEIFAYSTSQVSDLITQRIRKAVNRWMPIHHLSDDQFSQRIRDDQIDILVDLSGHNAGSRMRVMTLQPAPLLVKWVGGLINTTGLDAIDYLLSDSIESPQDDDVFYTEKLIRMPDDYICYLPPSYVPDIETLPALSNGYVTLGCFNNPIKVNEVVQAEWAKLLHEIPNARLFLKGHQFNSEELCQRMRIFMSGQGIAEERLILEGPSSHKKLLEAYNRVDIALDPWPYSGGLTTCEALMMGVPVVTMPGPTFAGRHSATHLVNAGMPELVTNSWEEYRQRVIGLAGDLESLSTIRTHLREILLQSPVCDGPRFAKHFTTAMRAIWQRYCEGKEPAALTLNKEGEAQFEDEPHPIELVHPEPLEDKSAFKWEFTGKITTLDNGAVLTSTPGATKLLKLGAFAMISFDPASKVTQPQKLQAAGEFQHFPHVVLGDGNPATLYACLDPAMSATLRPLASIKTLTGEEPGPKVLTQLPVNSIPLDKIEGLEAIDWLILDNMNDSLAVLENGEKALKNTLLIQARVNFQPTHEQQPELTLISHWAARHGFSFYRLNNEAHISHLPKREDLIDRQATQLASADAIYIPNAERMAALDDNQRMKLAFVLHMVYGMKDLAYKLINATNEKHSETYLVEEGYLSRNKQQTERNPLELAIPNRSTSDPEVSIICATYNHRHFIEDAIKGFLKQEASFNFEIIIHDDASTDGTREIVERYAHKYPNLIKAILQEENQYSQKRRPLDIAYLETRGRYIALCEGDDYWTDPKKLQKQYDFLETNADYVCCYHNAFVFNESGIITDSKLPEKYKRDTSQQDLLLNNCFILTLSLFFKKQFFQFPEEKGNVANGDNFLISMLGLYGKGKYMPEVDPAAYRIHPNSTWSSKSQEQKKAMLNNTFQWIAKYHERNGRYSISKFYREKSESLKL